MGDFEEKLKSEMKAHFAPQEERQRVWEWLYARLNHLQKEWEGKIVYFTRELNDDRIHVLVWCKDHKPLHSIDVVFVSTLFIVLEFSVYKRTGRSVHRCDTFYFWF